uniref:Ubiquitin-like protein ATG12 isoform X2 n=1 Tax=Rhizophora mucronata TaxID=61149 RepID=A0A2P2K4R4_RHIMU
MNYIKGILPKEIKETTSRKKQKRKSRNLSNESLKIHVKYLLPI